MPRNLYGYTLAVLILGGVSFAWIFQTPGYLVGVFMATIALLALSRETKEN